MTLGSRLKALRDRRGWTQPDAARSIGIEQSYLSKLENDRSVPSLDVFRRLIDTYDTSVEAVLEGLDNREIEHLRQLGDVAEFVDTQRARKRARFRVYVVALCVAVALGASLIFAGTVDLFFDASNDPSLDRRNDAVTFVGIFLLTLGNIGLLVASAKR